MTIEARKYHLIADIMQISDEGAIEQLEQLLKAYSQSHQSIQHLLTPMKKTLDVDRLVEEQGYKGISSQKMDQFIEEIALEEPIEELIKMI